LSTTALPAGQARALPNSPSHRWMHLDGPVIFLNIYGNECRRSETRHIIQFLPKPDIHPPKRLGLAWLVNLYDPSRPANRDDNALICLASLQAIDPEDMSAIQRSSAAHRRLQWFHRCTLPGRRRQIATTAFEADPGLFAHPARNSVSLSFLPTAAICRSTSASPNLTSTTRQMAASGSF
jgi:hypothetical protein